MVLFHHHCLVAYFGLQFFRECLLHFWITSIGSSKWKYQEAFKDMAKVLRWRLLADRDSSIRHADLILGSENLKNIVALWWESPKQSLTVFFCTLWVSF